MVTLVTSLCGRIPYKDKFENPRIKFSPIRTMDMDKGSATKNPRGEIKCGSDVWIRLRQDFEWNFEPQESGRNSINNIG